MDIATEVRLQKRRTLLAYIENTPEFLAASAAAASSAADAAETPAHGASQSSDALIVPSFRAP